MWHYNYLFIIEGQGLPKLHGAKCGYVFLLVASSQAVLVRYTLQGLGGGPRKVNCEQYGRRSADVY